MLFNYILEIKNNEDDKNNTLIDQIFYFDQIDDINFKKCKLDMYYSHVEKKKILKSLHFYVASQEAKIKALWAPALTPLIGKEKIVEFCQQLNDETVLLYEKDIYIPVFFLLYKNKTFHFIIKTPTLFNIIKYIYDIDKIYFMRKKNIYYLTLEELYYITFIKYTVYLYTDVLACLKDILNSFIKFKIKIIL